jgi:hypothetical protein
LEENRRGDEKNEWNLAFFEGGVEGFVIDQHARSGNHRIHHIWDHHIELSE